VNTFFNETCTKAPIKGNFSLPGLTGYTYQGEQFVEGVACGSWLSPATKNLTHYEYYDASAGQYPVLWTEPGRQLTFFDFQNRNQKDSVFEPPDHLTCDEIESVKIFFDFPKLWGWHGG
jgi:hypothetical protein